MGDSRSHVLLQLTTAWCVQGGKLKAVDIAKAYNEISRIISNPDEISSEAYVEIRELHEEVKKLEMIIQQKDTEIDSLNKQLAGFLLRVDRKLEVHGG